MRIELRNNLLISGQRGPALDRIVEAEHAARGLEDRGRLARVLAHKTHSLWLAWRHGEAIAAGQEALDFAREIGDFSVEVAATQYRGQVYRTTGEYSLAISLLRRNVERLQGSLARERFGVHALPSVLCRGFLADCLSALGDFAEAVTLGRDAVQIAESAGHPFSIVASLTLCGVAYVRESDFTHGVPVLERGLELCRAWDIHPWFGAAIGSLAVAYTLSGRRSDAASLLDEVEGLSRIGVGWGAALSEALLLGGRAEAAEALAVQELARDSREPVHRAWLQRVLAETTWRRDAMQAEKAVAYYHEALDHGRGLGLRPHVAHCHLGLGRLYERTGRREQAHEQLTTAATMYREMNMRFWLEQAEQEMTELASRSLGGSHMKSSRSGSTMGRATLGASVALVIVLGAAWNEPAAARPAQWTVVVSEKTGGADPLSEHGTNSQYYLIPHVVEALTRLELLPNERTWGVAPVLAEKWSFPDPRTLVVELRRGVKFQNGEELTAGHVKAAFDAFVTPEKPGRRGVVLKALGKAEVVGKHTVKFQLPKPDLAVLAATTHLLVPPLARHSMTREQFEAKPIGSGPYRVVDWPKDGTVRLEAWDGYRTAKAFPEKLIVRHVPEPSTRVFELAAGTAQVATNIPIESLPTIQASPKLEVVSLTGGSALSYVINLYKTTPPLRDRRVRQAMNHAVDRAAIVRTILGGRGTVMSAPLWPGWLGASDEIAPYAYDPEKAKALLKEAGYPNGFTFRWTVTQGVFVKDIEVAQAVANQLAKVGIKATIAPAERARLLAERSERDYDVLELIWTMSWHPAILFHFTLNAAYPDAKLAPKWGPMPAELARARQLMSEAGEATSLEEMGRGYVRLNQFMRDEAFWLYVNTVDTLWGIQKDVVWRPYPAAFPFYDDYWHRTGRKAPDSPTVPLVPR